MIHTWHDSFQFIIHTQQSSEAEGENDENVESSKSNDWMYKLSSFHTLRLFLIHIQLTNYQHRTVVAADAAMKVFIHFLCVSCCVVEGAWFVWLLMFVYLLGRWSKLKFFVLIWLEWPSECRKIPRCRGKFEN